MFSELASLKVSESLFCQPLLKESKLKPGEVLLVNHLFVVCCVIKILRGFLDTLQYRSHTREESLGLKDVLLR